MRFAPLVLGLLAALQDGKTEIRWNFQKGDAFAMSWTFHRERKTDKFDETEKRQVDAELMAEEESLKIAVKKVVWSVTTPDYRATLEWLPGKDPVRKQSVTGSDKARAKSDADARLQEMETLAKAEYGMEAVLGYMNVLSKEKLPGSLFDGIYVHSKLPDAPVKMGDSWKENATESFPPFAEDPEKYRLAMKATSTNAEFVKFNGRISDSFGGAKTAGKFSLEREFVFSTQGYLMSSKQETGFSRKGDDGVTLTSKQSLSIAKQKK